MQLRELLYKIIRYDDALRAMHLDKTRLSYWQEYVPVIKTRGVRISVEYNDRRPGIPHSLTRLQ